MKLKKQGKTSIQGQTGNLKEDGQTHSSNGNCIIYSDPACPGPTSDHIADSDIVKMLFSQPTMLAKLKDVVDTCAISHDDT